MTPILTKKSLKVNFTPSLRVNAHLTPPQSVETQMDIFGPIFEVQIVKSFHVILVVLSGSNMIQ